MANQMITGRARRVLKLVVENYIRTGQPIGSKTIARHALHAVSSATIRKVMADLEQAGYLHSPYTSSGRVPTESAYRMFVDHCLARSPIANHVVKQFRYQLTPDKDHSTLMHSVSNLLSRVTGLLSMVTLPQPKQLLLQRIECLPLAGQRILMVIVREGQGVQSYVLPIQGTYSDQELKQVSAYLTYLGQGKSLMGMRQYLAESLQKDTQQASLFAHILNAAFLRALATLEEERDYILSGYQYLLDLATERGLGHLREVFDVLSQKQEILMLLDKCLSFEGVQTYIGHEVGEAAFLGCSVVTAPYSMRGKKVGTLGVVGPSRMMYSKVIPLVDFSAKSLSNALN